MEPVFAAPVSNQFLIYSPLHSLVALVDGCAIDQIRASLQANTLVSDVVRPIVEQLNATVQSPAVPTGLIEKPLFLGIIPTRACNLGCRYCDFISPTNNQTVMSLSLARQTVDAYLDLLNRAGRRHAEIHFFGGEPFFAEEVVRFVVDYASLRASQLGLSTHFEAITNGFYNANVSKWIVDSFDTIILSLDGPAEIQERQRPARSGRATFATIFRNAKIFAAGSSELIIRVCVTNETVAQMTTTAEWLAQELHPSAVCFETLVASPLARASKLYPPSPWEFARAFMAAAQILAEYGIETVLSTANLQSLQISFCPVGKDALIISPDGMVDACYLLQEDWQRNDLNLRFGRVTENGFELDYLALQRIRDLTVDNKTRCTDCLCRYHCAGGCHVNHPAALTAGNHDDLCIQTRLVTIASLLRRIGQNALAESWLQDQQAQELAVMQPSDRLFDEVRL